MTTSNITFPLELVEAFVEQLAPGSGIALEEEIFQTLVSCTLASKKFSFAARKRLFSTLVIGRNWKHTSQIIDWHWRMMRKGRTEEASRRINSFLGLLADERSSDLALMIRRLHIIVDDERIILRQATNLHELLKVLSHRAHKLSILRVHGRYTFSWTTIPQETADGLYALCRSLSVNHLSFSGVYNIPYTIASVQEYPHLRYIDFEESEFAGNDAGMAAETTISPATSLIAGHLDVLTGLPKYGSYEICYTSHGQINIVGIDITIRLRDESQRLNQLLSDERIRSSLRYCCCTCRDTHELLSTTKAIDFGTMVLLRQLTIYLRVGLDDDIPEITTDITSAMNTLIDCLYYGNTKSALQEIKVTLDTEYDLYERTSMFDAVDFSSLQRLRIDSLRKKHPLIQSTQFCIRIGLLPYDSGPEVKSSVEEIVRKLITDAIALPPVDESFLPQIHICAEKGY
ncbi:hypothetical protein CVT25_014580 [Psilocybe cyanescens]|uniref:F-box domain-containing protein n=1 Tax=Psilocybe cyanescens TaxID=93625 RepID=A0A409WRA3_PSICY|nr:hypothetical protein CVT25_014580 [Psilocybe cyanescens]